MEESDKPRVSGGEKGGDFEAEGEGERFYELFGHLHLSWQYVACGLGMGLGAFLAT